MYKISICDDDKLYVEFIEKIIKDNSKGFETEILKYYSSDDFINNINKDIDLVFMDYKIDEMNGIDISKYLRKINPNAILVFITGEISPEPVFFELNTFRFIFKSSNEKVISDNIKDILKKLLEKNIERKILLSLRERKTLINSMDIVYAFKLKYGSEVVIKDENTGAFNHIICKERLKDLYIKLPKIFFSQPHSSYLVNLECIKSFNQKEIIMIDEMQIGISKSKKSEFIEKLKEYLRMI